MDTVSERDKWLSRITHKQLKLKYPEDRIIPYKRELDQLKKIELREHPKLRMYDVFITPVEKLIHLFNNEIFMTLFIQAHFDFENSVPNYGMMLNHKVYQVKYQFDLKNTALENFQRMTQFEINNNCVEHILQFLEENDLLNLCNEQ